MERSHRLSQLFWVAVAAAGAASTAGAGVTPPSGTPLYTSTFLDAVTGDAAPVRVTTAANIAQLNYAALGNGGRFTNVAGQVSYDIDEMQPGSLTQRADDYLNEVYERPTDQTYLNQSQAGGTVRFGLDPGGVKYYGYLDIENARVGVDASYLYVSIDLFSRSTVNTGSGAANNENELKGFYGFRIGDNAADPQSRGGHFVRFENPTSKAGTTFTLNPTASVFRDVNNNVGGTSISGAVTSTAEGTPAESGADGYEVQVVADGITNGNGGYPSGINALYTRVDPTDNTRVEFALDYAAMGYSLADLLGPDLFLLFQATETRNDAGDPFFNDDYNFNGAGTPNPDLRGVAGPNSAYLTTGLSGNVYRLDTLRGGVIPEPATLAAVGLFVGLVATRRPAARRA